MMQQWCGGIAGKTVLVTGAGRYRSIGRHVALEMARQGANLVLTGTGKPPSAYPAEEQVMGWRDVESVLAQVRELGGQGQAHVLDVRDPEAVRKVIEEASQEFGGIDFLINNAGASVGADRALIHELSCDQWRRVMDVNLDGAFTVASSVARHLVERSAKGAIVNISSIASRQCLPLSGAYSASKAALNNLSRTMAMELACYGIRVNAVLPGLIATSRIPAMEQSAWEDMVRSYVPLGEAGDGQEIANMCVFLCSDRGRWITGQEIAVDGGSSL